VEGGRIKRILGGAAGRSGKLIKIGAKVVSHGRYTTFRMAEVAVSRQMFRKS
jgi:hypothetical protein